MSKTNRNFHWPNGAHVAFAPTSAWETWPLDLGSPGSHQNTNRRPISSEARYRRDLWTVYEHAFSETGGIQRLKELYHKLGIRATVYANGEAVASFPEIAQALKADGHHLASFNWGHEYSVFLTPQEEAESIRRTVAAFREVLDAHPGGYCPPGGKPIPETYALLADAGYQWVGAVHNAEVPYVLKLGDRRLVAMSNYLLSDYDSYSNQGWTPNQLFEMARDEFDWLYAEGRKGSPRLVSFGTHAFLARGFRIAPYEAFLRYVQEKKKVWIATRQEIAEWVLSEFPDQTLDALYPGIGARSQAAYQLPGTVPATE